MGDRQKLLKDIRKQKGVPVALNSNQNYERNAEGRSQAVKHEERISIRKSNREAKANIELETRNALGRSQAVNNVEYDNIGQDFRNALGRSQAVSNVDNDNIGLDLRNALGRSQAIGDPDDILTIPPPKAQFEFGYSKKKAPVSKKTAKSPTLALETLNQSNDQAYDSESEGEYVPLQKGKKQANFDLHYGGSNKKVPPPPPLPKTNEPWLDDDDFDRNSISSFDYDERPSRRQSITQFQYNANVETEAIQLTSKKGKKALKKVEKKSKVLQEPARPQLMFTSEMLKKAREKQKPIEEKMDQVKIGPAKVLELFENRDSFPLSSFVLTINQNTFFGSSECIVTLSLSGIEQVTDLLFYHLMSHMIELPNLANLYVSGCHHLTDAGMKWCAQMFPYLCELNVNGCQQITEKTIHYFMDTTYSSIESISMVGAGLSVFPGKINTLMGLVDIAGCPLISPSTEMYKTKKRSALLDVSLDDLTVYKVVILKEVDCSYSFIEMVTKQKVTKKHMNIFPGYKVNKTDKYTYNLYEVETGKGLEEFVLSNGSIVILTYTSLGPDTINNLTNQMINILTKCPECIFVIADMSEAGGKTSASVVKEVITNLELWVEKFGADHTFQLGDLMMEYDFLQQKNFVTALNVLESIHHIQKNRETTYKCIVDADFSGGSVKPDSLKFLEKTITSLRQHYPWHGNLYHPMTHSWVVNPSSKFTKADHKMCALKDFANTVSDTMKFNMNPHAAGPFKELDQLFKLRHNRGVSTYFPSVTSKPVFLDLDATSDFFNKIAESLKQPSRRADVAGLSKDFPCFSREDLNDVLKDFKNQNDLLLEILEEKHLIVKLPLSCKHPDVKESTVYVNAESLPAEPHISLDHFWDGKFVDQLYSGKKYRIPILPENLLVIVLRDLTKICKVLLLWRDGAILQQGPVTYRLEIFRKGEYTGVLIEGKLHSRLKPEDEKYAAVDRIVWKGLRGVTSVFDSTLLKHGIFNASMYFFYQEKPKFFRDEALEWFSGVREKPYMVDNMQKLVPNHDIDQFNAVEQGTRCCQCDNCCTNNIDCPDNLSNYRYRSECGCKEYTPMCKSCRMCRHCVYTVSKAVSTVQPSFRMVRETETVNLTVLGSSISFGTTNLEYKFQSKMSYELFSHMKIVLVRGISKEIKLTNIEGDTIIYHTGQGKIDKIKQADGSIDSTVRDKKLECYRGYFLEIYFSSYDELEIHLNGVVIYTWDLAGPFVEVAINSLDGGNVSVASNHKVDFQGIELEGNRCCEMSLPSCVERSLIKQFLEALDYLFREGKDYSGAAGCFLPQDLTELDILHPTAQVLNKIKVFMPLCLTKNRFTDRWDLAKVAHLVNAEGMAVTETKDILTICMACNALLSQYPNLFLPDNMDKYFKGAASNLNSSVVGRGIQEIIRLIGMDLLLELGLDFSLKSELPVNLRRSITDTLPFMMEPEKSGVYATESLVMDGKILYLCEGHKASYQSRSDFTEMSLSIFGGYTWFIRDIKIVKTAIVSIPEELFLSMPFLIRCELYENLLEKIPDSIGNCKFLQKLDVADNNLTDLPMSLVNCKDLDRLDIGRNNMMELPKVVPKLKLKRLLMNNMLLASLPENIGDMEDLEMLYANGNCFTSLPKSMSKLKNLEDLSLAGVSWMDIKEGQHCTKQAFEEFLMNTRIGHWLDANNEDKIKLFNQFDLDANNVLDNKEMGTVNATLFNIFPRFGYKGKDPPDDDTPSGFPEEILDLPNVRYLNLQYQGIVHVPGEIKRMTSLQTFVISNNPYLLSIAGEVSTDRLKRLDLSNCAQLKTPPKEIRDRGFNTVKAYLRRLTTGSVECQRTKLMFVGLGGAGKTSLAKALMTSEFQTSLTGAQAITDGIDICTWTVNHDGNKVQYSVWDFAGQTVYYNTHQFFLSDRAVYLLLWNVRLGQEHAGLNFWLSSIRVHASKAPIFIVGTHMDQVPKAELAIEELMEDNPQIEGCFFVSSYTGQGIDELKSSLLKTTLKQEYMGEMIPAVYLDFENIILKKRQNNVDLVEYTEVEKMANNAGLVDKEEIAQAVQFLHDLGSIQHFTHEVLKSKVVINPQWIVDVMARVVSVKASPIQDGKLMHTDLKKVWADYPAQLYDWLLQLTEEYDLTFKLVNEKANLVPCLLPEKKPEVPWPEIKENSGIKETKMVYHFEYLPAGLFNRAQVRLQEFSDSAIIWKRGSFLRKNEHIALLHHHKDTEMIVKVQGPRPDNILFLVHEVFESLIGESFRGVKFDFSVPCPDCLVVTTSSNAPKKKDPHMFSASMIRRAIDLQAPFLQCLRFFHTISVGDLQSIMPPDTTQDYDVHLAHAVNDLDEYGKKETLDIFISFCDLDAPKDKSNVIHPEDVYKELVKDSYKCFYPDSTKKYPTDVIAKSLIDSSIFVAFVSNNYVNDQVCCNMFKFAKQTLRKPFIIVACGPDHEWKKSALGLLVSDVVFVNMIDSKKGVFSSKMDELRVKIKEIYSIEVSNEHPPCFISYCWKNSKEAVELGTKSEPQCYSYTPDPRDIASHLSANGVPCWLDTKRIGFGMSGLLDDIAKGLLNSHLMISFLSDEYAHSHNSMTELNFAALTLKIPVILAIVGQGDKWKASEANMLAFRAQCPVVDLRKVSENEGKEKILNLAKDFLKDVLEEKEKMDEQKKAEGKQNKKQSLDKKDSLSFQELYELAQRKFLHQITQYASSQDTYQPYPRLFLIDVMKSEMKSENSGEDKSMDDLDISFRDGKYCLHIMCECETGWHAVSKPLELDENFGQNSLSMYAPYLSRITALMKHNEKFKMNAMSDKHGVAYLRYLTESSAMELTECKEEYLQLREKVMKWDTDSSMGGLSRCRLPSGKISWLCKDHISKMKVTVLTNEMIAHDKTAQGEYGTDFMLESLKDMDPKDMKLKFKSSAKSKRDRTAPKDAKEQVNIQKKQSLLRQKSLLNEELLAEYKSKVKEEPSNKTTTADKTIHEEKQAVDKAATGTSADAAASPASTSQKSDPVPGPSTVTSQKPPLQSTSKSAKQEKTTGGLDSSNTRPKSDTEAKSDASQASTKNQPLTLSKMGRSKSKACSVM